MFYVQKEIAPGEWLTTCGHPQYDGADAMQRRKEGYERAIGSNVKYRMIADRVTVIEHRPLCEKCGRVGSVEVRFSAGDTIIVDDRQYPASWVDGVCPICQAKESK